MISQVVESVVGGSFNELGGRSVRCVDVSDRSDGGRRVVSEDD